jgi:pseudaminic acid synthase
MKNNKIIIKDNKIGSKYPPFIIAEMSGNHNQSLSNALNLVKEAAKSGAHAIKLQTYTADTMTLDIKKDEFVINDEKSLWNGENLYELYQIAHTPWEWHKPIMELAKSLGIVCFSTPFDETAVDFLEDLNVPAYKIASFENIDLPLIRKVAATKKPMIISTGMATISEIGEAVSIANENGCSDLILLKCTSAYPASPRDINLRTIPHMKDLFKCEVGLSDHTLGIGTSLGAIALGASVIEKHFTIDRSEGGVDSAFSIEPLELFQLVKESKQVWESVGDISYGITKDEEKSLDFRRSIYISKNLKKGETLTKSNIRKVRPGRGLSPKYFEIVVGKKINCDVSMGTPLSWDLME